MSRSVSLKQGSHPPHEFLQRGETEALKRVLPKVRRLESVSRRRWEEAFDLNASSGR